MEQSETIISLVLKLTPFWVVLAVAIYFNFIRLDSEGVRRLDNALKNNRAVQAIRNYYAGRGR
jgi:hypothetical protein